MSSSFDPYQVAAWFDPRLPAPDSQQAQYAGQPHVRRLNGPKRNTTVDADYRIYHELYTRYLDQRRLFLNKPAAIQQVQVDPFYRAQWADLGATIQELAECDYVHDFGGSKTRILDTAAKVDVTVKGVPLNAWTSPVPYAQGQAYDIDTQMIGDQGYESYYASNQRPGQQLDIYKNPATTHYYKSLLWAAVHGQ